MSPMVMTNEACQQDKTPFDLFNDFGPLRHKNLRKKEIEECRNLYKKL